MTQSAHTIKRASVTSEPLVDQGMHYGCDVTWNPDDGSWYVLYHDALNEFALARFNRWANAIQFCRRHAK